MPRAPGTGIPSVIWWMMLATLVVTALAYWDEERESRAALDDFAQEQARLAKGVSSALAARLSSYVYLGRTFAWDTELEKRLAALAPAEIRDALRRHIDPKKLSVMKAGDFK